MTEPTTSSASLLATVQIAHDRLRRALEATGAPPRDDDPRAAVRALDGLVSGLCSHLGAIEQVLYPAARRRLPGRAGLVAVGERSARQLQRVMYSAEQCLWGDARSSAGTAAEFAELLSNQLTKRCQTEEQLARALDEVLEEDERRSLSERFTAAVGHSPTRPHPHRPHVAWSNALTLRMLGFWDDVLDAMDVRPMREGRADRAVRPLGRWSAYAMGGGLRRDSGSTGVGAGQRADDGT